MSKKQDLQDQADRLQEENRFLQQKLREEQFQERRVRRALYAGTRRYLRQGADLLAATGMVAAQKRVLEHKREQLKAERSGWSRIADGSERVVEHLREELRLMTEHRDELQEFADSLQEQRGNATELAEEEVARLLRALSAGVRRYRREQQRANERVALVEESALQSTLTMLEAVQEAHESRKLAAAATRRADKLAAKLMIRARELGRMRRVYADMFAGRNRSLEAAGKRARGLQASLAKQRARTDRQKQRADRLAMKVADLEPRELELRRKLRESNKSVLMASLGGGLEVQPISGLPPRTDVDHQQGHQ